MTDHARPFRHLTEAEALRALYVDFEGEKDKPPVLLGVHRRGRGARPFVQQDVLDETFAGLAGSCLSLHDAVEKVVRRAEHGDRRIVAWTEHELGWCGRSRAEDPELVARFEARFVNARAVAERWRNKLHGGDKPERGRLVDYLALVGYPVPEEAARRRRRRDDPGPPPPARARALPYPARSRSAGTASSSTTGTTASACGACASARPGSSTPTKAELAASRSGRSARRVSSSLGLTPATSQLLDTPCQPTCHRRPPCWRQTGR